MNVSVKVQSCNKKAPRYSDFKYIEVYFLLHKNLRMSASRLESLLCELI